MLFIMHPGVAKSDVHIWLRALRSGRIKRVDRLRLPPPVYTLRSRLFATLCSVLRPDGVANTQAPLHFGIPCSDICRRIHTTHQDSWSVRVPCSAHAWYTLLNFVQSIVLTPPAWMVFSTSDGSAIPTFRHGFQVMAAYWASVTRKTAATSRADVDGVPTLPLLLTSKYRSFIRLLMVSSWM